MSQSDSGSDVSNIIDSQDDSQGDDMDGYIENDVEVDEEDEKGNSKKQSDDEEEANDQSKDGYQNDSFVVDDEDGEVSDHYSKEVGSQSDKSLEWDEGDQDIVDQGLKKQKKKQKKKRRLKKNRKSEFDMDVEQNRGLGDFVVQPEGYNDVYGQAQSNIQRQVRDEDKQMFKSINKIFPDLEEDEISQEMIEEEELKEEDILEPGMQAKRFRTKKDLEIVECDMPERLQLRRKNQPLPDQTEKLYEALWIAQKFMAKRKLYNDPQALENLQKRIQAVIDELFIHNEIMYIWTYFKWKFYPELSLEDLWEIYNLDQEWSVIYPRKKLLEQKLEEFAIKYGNQFEISNSVKALLNEAYDLKTLDYIQEYINYQQNKFITYNEKENKKRPSQTVFAERVIKKGLNKYVEQAIITADDLAFNLAQEEYSKCIKPPKLQFSPKELAKDFLRTDIPKDNQREELVHLLNVTSKYAALELYYHPIIRSELKKRAFNHALISTKPTAKGNANITIYTEHYRVKRIQHYPIREMKHDLFLEVLDCEQQGLITVQFHYKWSNEEQNELLQRIKDRYLQKDIPDEVESNRDQVKVLKQWNVLRKEIIGKFYKKLKPELEKEFRDLLFQEASKFTIRQCQYKFRDMMSTGPYIKEGRTTNVLSVIMEPQQNGKLYFSFVNKDGQVDGTLILQYLSTRNKNHGIMGENYQKDKLKLMQFFSKYTPEVVVLGANNPDIVYIKMRMDEIKTEVFANQNDLFWIFLYDCSIPSIFAKSDASKEEFPDYSLYQRTAIHFGRYIQNPMSEILNLWNENPTDNKLLLYNFHPLQKMVNQQHLQNALEEVAVEWVNRVGLDINRLVDFPHLRSPLQFISGLGPRKATHFLNKIKELKTGFLTNRLEIHKEKLMTGEQVIQNCMAFLRVENPIKGGRNEEIPYFFDLTRIHLVHRKMAIKIALDALETRMPRNFQNDRQKQKYYNTLYKNLQNNIQELQELELDEYAEHLNQRPGNENQLILLNFIVDELKAPFRDPRTSIKDLKNQTEQDLFYLLTKQNPAIFREYQIVTARITKVFKDNLSVIIGNNIRGRIDASETSDKFNDPYHKRQMEKSWSKNYQPGQIVKAKIKYISFKDRSVKLSIRPKLLQNHRESLYNLHDSFVHKYFRPVENEDFPQQYNNKNVFGSLIPRKINHPKFKNISLTKALTTLEACKVGDFIIRPSSRGRNWLTLTWKFNEGIYVHLPIEESKIRGQKGYFLGKQNFESLDEIIEEYIDHCNDVLYNAKTHPKFQQNITLQELEQMIRSLKQQDKQKIPYRFGCFQECPQYLILLYQYKPRIVEREFIKIKPEGLFFHNKNFPNLGQVIRYFKQNFQSFEYKRFKKKFIPPVRLTTADGGKRFSNKGQRWQQRGRKPYQQRGDRDRSRSRTYGRENRDYGDRDERRQKQSYDDGGYNQRR